MSLLRTCQIRSINAKQAENNRKVQAQRRQVFKKNAKQRFFSGNTTKNGQKHAKLRRICQTAFSHAKPLFERPNFRHLALKMPIWQP